MLSSKRALLLCCVVNSVEEVQPIKLNFLEKMMHGDGWQDLFMDESHVQQAQAAAQSHKSASTPRFLSDPTSKPVPASQNLQVEAEASVFQQIMKKARSGGAIVDFLFGVLLLTLSFPTIWMNERRQVRMYKVISAADEQCIDKEASIDADTPILPEDDYKLLRVQGKVFCKDGVADPQIKSVAIKDCIYLERIVEKYIEVEREDGDEDGGNRFYKQKKWVRNESLESATYDVCDKFYAKKATMGKYLISKYSLEKLQHSEDFLVNSENETEIKEEVKRVFKAQNVVVEAGKVVVHMNSSGQQVGDFRIQWKKISANREFTVMAQQMKTEDGVTRSFRQWNPDKDRVDVPWGQDNGSYNDQDMKDDGDLSGCYCCLMSGCVEKLFKYGFQEVINIMKPGIVKKKEIIKELNAQNACFSTMFRLGTWIAMCWGTYLLFSPIIALFKWIPLVGWLLGAIISFAAVIFALIVGSILHLLTMTFAWIFYRPLFGIGLLIGVGLLVSLLFYGGNGAAGTPA